jgi:glycosyltransferase involved in cell wall biosynthesis
MQKTICLIHHAGIQGYPYLIDTAKLLAREGWNVDVLALSDAPLPEYNFQDANIRIFRFPHNITGGALKQKIRRVTGYIFWAVKTAQRRQYSVFMGFDQNGLIAASLASMRSGGVPVLFYSPELHFSGDLESITDRLKKKLEIYFSRRSKAVIIQDRRRADVLIKDNGLNNERVYIVPNAPLASDNSIVKKDYLCRLLSQYRVEANKVIVLYMGVLEELYRVKDIALSVDKWPNECVFILHGWGDKKYVEELQKIANRYNPPRVILHPKVLSYDDLPILPCSADIGIAIYRGNSINRYEMASGKLYQYMKAGLPVIASDFPNLKEVVEDNALGICINSDEIENLVSAVTQLAANPELRRNYGMNARRVFIEKYAYERNFAQVLSLLNSLVKR